LISFGRFYIANPDLAERIIKKQVLNDKWDMKTFYGFQHGAKGYNDYPVFSE
jgi:2,4-dienoyl-CoA reductase-like NADH-dependent reductase (Old Yellow Enzyme family)